MHAKGSGKGLSSQQDCISLALRAPLRDATGYHARMARRAQHLRCSLSERSERGDNKLDNATGDLSEYLAARTCASCWLDKLGQARRTACLTLSDPHSKRIDLIIAGGCAANNALLSVGLIQPVVRSFDSLT